MVTNKIDYFSVNLWYINWIYSVYSNNSLINMNTICVLKKCIQIDFSEYTLFLNTLVKFEFTYLLTIPSLLGK